MEVATAITASLPPVFAIVAELFNPIGHPTIHEKVTKDLAKFELGKNHKPLIDTASLMVAGALEASGLAPTFVAAGTAGFGIIYEYVQVWLKGSLRSADFWVIGGYLSLLLLLVFIVLHYLVGQTFFQIEATQSSWKTWFKTFHCSGSTIIMRLILLVNSLLLLFIWVTYWILPQA